jgi:UDP-N-acetylglucosamine 3-dehydrogenase
VKRFAVIGAGAMGRNHIRVYHDLATAGRLQFAGVAEPDEDRQSYPASLGVPVYTDYREMLARERLDGISVVVPTQGHFQTVTDALAAGCHVLVEKPIAATVDEAKDMARLAHRAERTLAVGHIERFNPAIIELKQRLEAGQLGRIFQIHARRLGPFPARVRDVGVVIDLATHDLDMMRFLTGSDAVRVFAETRREVHTSNEDLFNGMIRFADKTMGLLEINWLTPTKIRELYVTGERGMFQVDYLTQDLFFYENAEVSALSWNALSVLRGVSEGAMTRFALNKVEPLRAELEAFLDAVEGQPGGVVSGVDGIAALELALALIESGDTHEPVELARR